MPLIAGAVVLVAVVLVLILAVARNQSSIDAAFAASVSIPDRLHTFHYHLSWHFHRERCRSCCSVRWPPGSWRCSCARRRWHGGFRATRCSPCWPALGLGIVLPVCECGIVVVVRRLLAKGLPLRVGVAFLLAAPVVNPIVFASTLTAFGAGKMLAARFILSFAIASVIALLFGAARPEEVLRGESATGDPHQGHGHDHDHHGHHHHADASVERLSGRIRAAVSAAADDLFDVGRYLVIGSLLAAALQALVPREAILAVGSAPVSSVMALSALAFVISVCSTVDAFVALSFVGTFTPASILAFLVFGPMVDIKSSLMFWSIFRPRVVAYLIVLPLGATLVACLLLATQVGF